jgi:DNA excision repair protein ERCC-8
VDGAVRVWDVRKSNGLVALLDQEDIIGLADRGASLPARTPRLTAKAHVGPVNGLTWTDDGAYLITAGHDRRIRVWDAATGANTLANFGPSIRNSQMGTVTTFVSPIGLTPPMNELLFFPNETEILVMDLHEGPIVTRLRSTGPTVASVGTQRGGEKSIRNRVTSSK